ncbi:MAG: glycosyltransferase family 9 protein [Roseiarcus sp.]|jgi:ADP-heptose:LPS heptosyltransferase
MKRSSDRVLFITAGSIGDAALTSGLLRHLVESEPEARFTIAAGPGAVSLFADTPRLEQLIPIRKRRRAGHWLDLWRQVAGRRWKIVVDMRGSGLAFVLWAQRRFIYRSFRQPAGTPPLHKAQEAARTIGLLANPPSPFLYVSAATQARADELIGAGGPILAIAPAATWPPKTWPAERFAEAAVELLGAGGPLAGGRALLTGGRDDGPDFEPIRSALPPSRVIDLVGLDLLTTYACFRRVALFVGNDSGLMHLAAAAGAPTLGLFGPSDERRYGPWGARTTVVRSARSFSDCEAAIRIGGTRKSYMTDLSVASVVRAARDLLARTSAGVDAGAAAVS